MLFQDKFEDLKRKSKIKKISDDRVKAATDSIIQVTDIIWEKKDYFSSDEEYYARYMQLKHYAVDKKLINNIFDDINKDMFDYDILNDDSFVAFALSDLDKLK